MSSKTVLFTLVVALAVLASARALGRLPALVLFRALRSSRAYPSGISGLRALSEDDDIVDSQDDKGLFPAPADEGKERHSVTPPSKKTSKRRGSFDLFQESFFSALASLFNSKEWKRNSIRPSNVVKGMPPFKKGRRAGEWVKDKEKEKEMDRSKPNKKRGETKENKNK